MSSAEFRQERLPNWDWSQEKLSTNELKRFLKKAASLYRSGNYREFNSDTGQYGANSEHDLRPVRFWRDNRVITLSPYVNFFETGIDPHVFGLVGMEVTIETPLPHTNEFPKAYVK